MPLAQQRAAFTALKALRRKDPEVALRAVGLFGLEALKVLSAETVRHPFGFGGQGAKTYAVAAIPGATLSFSRAINTDLFISEVDEFVAEFASLTVALKESAGKGILTGITAARVNRVCYSAVVGYAAAVDIFQRGDRASPGSYLEMMVGPIVSILTGRKEGASIYLPIPETGDVETVTTDLSFPGGEGEVVLVIPTKISTRERISQAYVHQLILDRAATGGTIYRSALVIANENNTMFPAGLDPGAKTYEAGSTQETLVPGTIVLYHKYVSQLSGLYYLDPPYRYLYKPPPLFPLVRTFGDLLTEDLPVLLEPKPSE